MNTTATCDRFEREGVLSVERGLPLLDDAHFECCADCQKAKEKHSAIRDALPFALPPTPRAPIGWQARVLAQTKPEPKREKRHETPEVFAFVGLAAMVAAAFFGVTKRSALDSFAMTGDWSAKPNLPVLSDPQIAPLPVDENAAKEEKAAEKQKMPLPVAPMPRTSRKAIAPLLAMPEQTNEPKAEAPIVAAPDTAPMAEQNAPKAATPHKVTRPNKLYGFNLAYPKAAKDARIQGETSVQCTIRKDGKNTNCRILKSLPFLDEPVLAALAAAKSDPITVDGKPVDNSDHIWHITITLVDPIAPYNPGRGLPVVTWKNSAP